MKNNFREIMKSKAISSKELASKMNVTEVTVSKLINGKIDNLKTFKLAADVLGVELWELFAENKNNVELRCPHCGGELKLTIL